MLDDTFGFVNLVWWQAVPPLQGFCLNINSMPQGFVALHPVLPRAGTLPLKT